MISVIEKIRAAGGTIEGLDGDLRLRVPKGLLSAAERLFLMEHKAEVVQLLPETPVSETPVEVARDATAETVINRMDRDLNEGLDEVIPPSGAACQSCGSLELWQDLGGRWHCAHCQAGGLLQSQRLVEQAARFRRLASVGHFSGNAHRVEAMANP